MSDISQFGVPGGTGVLHPALTNRFRVVFEVDGIDTRVLTSQALSVGNFAFLPNSSGVLQVKFENDLRYSVVKLLNQMVDKTFKLKLEVLDGNETVVHTFDFTETKIDFLEHSQFDYRGGDTNRSKGKIKFKDYAALEGELTLEDIAKMKTLFDSITFEFESDFKPEVEHTTSVTVLFCYKSVA